MLQALANIGSQPRITAEISKEAKLTITPITLDTASSAEFDIDFDVGEPSPPETVNQKTKDKDLLDRVADYHVTSHVRVDALKLFQVSAFDASVSWHAGAGHRAGLGRYLRHNAGCRQTFPSSAVFQDSGQPKCRHHPCCCGSHSDGFRVELAVRR
jgi:hypothetical protein